MSERITRSAPAELRTRTTRGGAVEVVGHASVFDRWSVDLGGFREKIARGAFTKVLRRKPTVPLVLNHSISAILASTRNGSLTLEEDTAGLAIRATLTATSLGRDVAVMLAEGLVDQMSFAFTVKRDRWDPPSEGLATRTVLEVGQLLDVSIVVDPAYPAAEVSLAGAEARSRIATTIKGPPVSTLAPAALKPTTAPKPVIATRERMPYGPGSRHSYFRDLAVVESERGSGQIVDGVRRVRRLPAGFNGIDDVAEAERRLEVARGMREQRGLPTAFALIIPTFAAELFSTAAHAKAVIASSLKQVPLKQGDSLERVDIPRITTPATVTTVMDNEAGIESSPATASDKVPVTLNMGFVRVSLHLLERDGVDEVIAQELGASYGERLERIVANGSGVATEPLGLLNIAGLTTVSYTDATPTGSEALVKVMGCRAGVSTAMGYPPPIVAMHPRRASWFAAALDSAGNQLAIDWKMQPLESAGIPTNLGAGGNEDAIIVLDPEQTPLVAREPEVRPLLQPLASTMEVLYRVHGFAALGSGRQPFSIGRVIGTGLVPPTF